MKISLYLIIYAFFCLNLSALELHCKFEEVYQDNQQQNGLILIKNDHLRYQYYDSKLYTIIKNKYGSFLIPNYQKEKFQKINNSKIIDSLIKIYDNYPHFKNEYIINDMTLKIDKSLDTDFLKRIAIISEDRNLSIYFFDCEKININKKFFQVSPLFDFK